MTYTLTVNNTGTANATGVKVVDTVPAGLTAISANGTSLFVCGVAGQTVTCTGGAVNQGSNATHHDQRDLARHRRHDHEHGRRRSRQRHRRRQRAQQHLRPRQHAGHDRPPAARPQRST